MTTPDKESEETGKVCECGDPGPHHCGPVDDVVARFREMVKEHVGEGADIMVYPNEIVFSQQRIEQFILGEIQAAREEERTKWRGVIEDQTELWEDVGAQKERTRFRNLIEGMRVDFEVMPKEKRLSMDDSDMGFLNGKNCTLDELRAAIIKEDTV